MTQAIPEGYSTVTVYLILKGTDKALEFYAKAFGAKETVRLPSPDGKGVMHAEMKLGNSVIMLGEEMPEAGAVSPQSLGGSGVGVHLYVEDVDAAFAKAVEAGCTAKMPPADMFWGDRFAKLEDPFGHQWSLATHTEDLSEEEMMKRMAEQMGQGGGS
jgi:uncharacterized glyoxalase superfamily protein PhnB